MDLCNYIWRKTCSCRLLDISLKIRSLPHSRVVLAQVCPHIATRPSRHMELWRLGAPLLSAGSGPQESHSNTTCQPKEAGICFVLFGPFSPFTTWTTLGSHLFPRAPHVHQKRPTVCFVIFLPHLLFYKWTTFGSHPFCLDYKKARGAASLPEGAHIRMLAGHHSVIYATADGLEKYESCVNPFSKSVHNLQRHTFCW